MALSNFGPLGSESDVDSSTSLVAPSPIPDGEPPQLELVDPQQGTPKPPLAPAVPKRRVPSPPLQGAAMVASKRDPQQWAKVTELADRTGLQPDFVARNYDELSKADDDRRQTTAMANVSPTFAAWLEDPDNATLAKHEMAPLSQVDQGARLLVPSKDEDHGFFSDVGGATATGMADLGQSAGLLAAAFGHVDPKRAASFIADMAQRGASLREQAPDYRKEYLTASERHAGDVNKAWQAYLASSSDTERGIVQNALESLRTGGATLGEALSLIGAAATRPRGLGYGLVESLASMTPIVGAAAAGGAGGAALGSVVPVVGTAIGGIAGGMAGTFAGAAPLNVGAEVAQELVKRGIDLKDPAAVERALSDPKLMQMVRQKAIAGGVTSAAVMSLFAGFGGALGGAAERAGAGAALKVAAKAGDAGVQAVGVAAGGEAGAVAKGEPIEPGRALSTTLEMLGFGLAADAVGAGRRKAFHADPVEAAKQVTAATTEALRAAHDAQALSEIGAAMKAAPTTASLPERVKSLIETATGGRDSGTVFFQSAEWNRYWQEQGASPAKAAADILGDGGKAYHDAETTGAPIAIPLSDYVAHVGPTEHFEGLLDVARMKPDGMSLGEAHEYLQSLPGTMKEIADEAGAAKAGQPVAESAVRVGKDVEAQLLAAGAPATEARAQAKIYEAAFRTMGERTGQDPEALYQQYGLRVGRAEAPAVPTLGETEARIEHTPLEEAPAATLQSLKVGPQGKSDVRTLLDEELPAAALHLEKKLRTIEASENPLGADAVRQDLATVIAEQARRAAGETRAELPFNLIDAQGRSRGRFTSREDALAAMQEKGLTEAAVAPENLVPVEEAVRAAAAEPSAPPPTTLNQSATIAAGRESLKKFGLEPGQRYTRREVAAALEARQREKYGTIAADDRSPEARNKIAKWMVAEILHELKNPEASGIGRYTEKFQAALDEMGERFPELKTDQNARDLMTALIAVTSDGAEVSENFAMAMGIYDQFKQSGRFEMQQGHNRQASIIANLAEIQHLHDEMGGVAMRNFLLEEKPIRELKQIAKTMGLEFKSDYQAHITMPMAAIVFGPKLGAFYANLMGKANYLTMDRWWSRTFNRYRGTLLQAPTEAGLARFKELLGKPRMSDDAALAAVVPYREAYKEKGYKNGTEIEKAANTIYKMAFENLEDTPFNATDRTFMLDTVDRAQQLLKKQGYDITKADIQAILWYYEKKLYGQLSGKESRTTVGASYADAARALVRGEPVAGGSERSAAEELRAGAPEGSGEVREGAARGEPAVFGDERAAVAAAQDEFQAAPSAEQAGRIVAAEGVRTLQQSAAQRNPVAESPAFKEWFGASKVIANDGAPLVVYHGTPSARPISRFKTPAYFTEEPSFAEMFAGERTGGGSIYPVYLRIERPYVIDGATEGRHFEWSAADVKRMKAEGFDGVIVRGGPDASDIYTVFDKHQIKSATANAGTFDRTSPNILEQPAWHGSPHLFDEFSLQRIGSGEGAAAYGWGLYFTNEKEIAKFYRDQLTPPAEFQSFRLAGRDVFRNGEYKDYSPRNNSTRENVWTSLVEDLLIDEGDLISAKGAGKEKEYILRKLDERIESYKEEWPEGVAPAEQLRKEIERPGGLKLEINTPTGRLYKVEIPEEDTMLDWDAPLKTQPEPVRTVIRQLLKSEGYLRPGDDGPRQLQSAWKAWVNEKAGMAEGDKGGTVYSALVNAALRYDGNPVNEFFKSLAADAKAAGRGPIEAHEAASRYLASLGVTGIKYGAGQISNIKNSTATNYVIFDDKLIKIAEFEQAARGGGARGRITFGSDRTFNIDLLEKADRSTFLHETGHFYLEVLQDLAKQPAAAPDLVADHATILKWLGAEEGKPLTTEQHEQFARGFEAYLMEGKAPSSALRQTFYRFRNWLLGIYQHLQNLNVELTPEVRGVFDRLLATKEEIAAEEARQQAQPLFADPRALGMSEEQAQKYETAVAEAHQAAEEQLSTKMMKEVIREQSAEWKAWRDPIRAQVEAEVNARPEYKALAYLQKHTNPDGTALPEGTPELKLNREAVVDTFGAELAARLPRGVMASTDKGGTNISIVAEMFGFRSSRELIDALVNVGPRKTLIEYITDQRMQQEHGERPTAPEIQDAAKEAVRGGEKRAQLLRLELEHLASEDLPKLKGLIRQVTRAVPPEAETNAQADRIVGDTTVRDLRPDLFGHAADRAGTQAREALLKGDVEAAFEAKRRQVLAAAVYDAATRAKESIDTALETFKQVFRSDETLAERRDMDLVNGARAVLAAYGIGRTDKPPASYLEQLRKYDPEMYETVNELVTAASERAADYRTISYNDFADLAESVSAMWDLSRRTRQMEIDGKKVDRQAVEEELGEKLEALTTPGPRAGYHKAATAWDKTKMGLLGARAALTRVENWVDAADIGDPQGAFRRYLWNPISEGITQYRVAKRQILEKYLNIVHSVEKTLGQEPIAATEINYEFKNKGELLGAMLHTGNSSNLRKLLLGRRWADVMEDGQMDTGRWDSFVRRMQQTGILTKLDYDYLQATWNLFEELKPGAQKAHKEMYGRYFSEITHDAFTTPFGEYQGGYYPAKADPFMVPDAAIRREQESVLGSNNSFMFPTTGRGFTKQRVEYNRPLIIDASYVPSSLDAVLRFTHIEPRVRDVARVVMSRNFRPTLDEFDPTVGGDMLVPWLQRAAQQRIDTPTAGRGGAFIDNIFREMRTRTGLSIMTANVVNSVQQVTGLFTSGVKVKGSHLGPALWRYLRAPGEMSKQVSELSDFMATRETALVMEIQKSIDHLMLNPSKYDELRAFAKEHGYFLSAGAQNIVDTITWMGKYDEVTSAGKSNREAIREADSAVRMTQGSFAPEDVSRFETGTPFVRSFTQFYSYFNAMANLQGSEFQTVARSVGLRKGAGRLLYVYLLGIALPSVVWEATSQIASGDKFDENDDGPWDDVLKLLIGAQVSAGLTMIPGVGPAIKFAIGKFTGAPFNDHINTSPAISTIESVATAPVDVYKAIRDKQISTKGIRDVLTAISLLSGIPVTWAAKPIGYLHDVNTGKAQPTGAIDFTRGLITGRPGKP